MKDTNRILNLQETEELCRLYLDCRLSVLEEQELEYVLSQVDYNSVLIREVRSLMGIENIITEKIPPKIYAHKKRSFLKLRHYLGAAASLALLIGIGLTFFTSNSEQPTMDSYYIAYANGHRLNDEAAKRQIESELQTAEEFMKTMSEQEAHEKEMIEKFTSINPFEE